MLFTHHSHSGQFCTHATSTLEEVIQAAIAKGLTSLALTEHIPRDEQDHYPKETEAPCLLGGKYDLWTLFEAYYAEAHRLRELYSDQIQILIGFEGEWVRSPRSGEIIRELQRKYDFDLFIGSVHHVHAIPIDYDEAEYVRARDQAGGSDADLAADYFDSQLEMLKTLRPPIVGHFDLIRLKADAENRDRDWRTWGGDIWKKIQTNLALVAEYGGVLEINSAALRKGLEDVYPRREIVEEFLKLGGKLTLSDDSHGVDQICTHYAEALECIGRAGVEELWYLTLASAQSGAGASTLSSSTWKAVALDNVKSRLKSCSTGTSLLP